MDLVQFLRDRLDDEERTARAATAGPWREHDTHLGQYGYAATVLSGEGNDTDLRAWLPSMSQEPWDEARNVWADAAHIAAHDPARVLRNVEAKRSLLDRYEELVSVGKAQGHVLGGDVGEEYLHVVLPTLALTYADHPGFREEWRL